MKRAAILLPAALLLGAGLSWLPAAPPLAVTPAADAVFTSTREITSLLALPDGTLWAGTIGGVLRRAPDGSWRKWTRLDGMAAHEVRRITVGADGTITAMLPRRAAAWQGGKWVDAPAPEPGAWQENETCRTVWRGRIVVATLTGLQIGERSVPLPPSRGTHVSALIARGEALWAALFGDGLWTWDGAAWRAANVGLPPQAREITALAAQNGTLWVGTRRAGVWRQEALRWTQHLPPDEPFDHNVQALAMENGALFVSTLEDGLATRTPQGGWRHEAAPVLSSGAPRQTVALDGALYLRHGNGRVDRRGSDGVWTRHVFPDLPRKQVSALAADGQRLYVAQWGGWSEWDGRWTHRLAIPELQGLPITALLPDGDALWVGTQGRGLAEIERATGRFLRWHDERDGLPDDWITVLARAGKTLYAGTFVGGLARWDGRKWTTAPELAGQNVTDLEPDGENGVFVATRSGVWHEKPDGTMARLDRSFLDREAQALLRPPGGDRLWIGTRTGLFFVRAALSR